MALIDTIQMICFMLTTLVGFLLIPNLFGMQRMQRAQTRMVLRCETLLLQLTVGRAAAHQLLTTITQTLYGQGWGVGLVVNISTGGLLVIVCLALFGQGLTAGFLFILLYTALLLMWIAAMRTYLIQKTFSFQRGLTTGVLFLSVPWCGIIVLVLWCVTQFLLVLTHAAILRMHRVAPRVLGDTQLQGLIRSIAVVGLLVSALLEFLLLIW